MSSLGYRKILESALILGLGRICEIERKSEGEGKEKGPFRLSIFCVVFHFKEQYDQLMEYGQFTEILN